MRKTRQTIKLLVACAVLTACAGLPLVNEIYPADKEDTLFDSLKIEVVYMKDCAPSATALIFLKNRIVSNAICKRDGVEIVVQPEISLPPRMVWTIRDFQRSEEKHRKLPHIPGKSRKMNLFVLYLKDGMYFDARGIRNLGGLTYGESSTVLWWDHSQSREGGVLLHEFGHTLNASGFPRDPAHKAHCPNNSCVMYYTVPSFWSDFCVACRKQLKQLRK